MELLTVFYYVISASSAGLILSVILQARSGGLGAVFGGSGGGEYASKRGMEAVLYNFTIVLAVVFAVSSLAVAILSV